MICKIIILFGYFYNPVNAITLKIRQHKLCIIQQEKRGINPGTIKCNNLRKKFWLINNKLKIINCIYLFQCRYLLTISYQRHNALIHHYMYIYYTYIIYKFLFHDFDQWRTDRRSFGDNPPSSEIKMYDMFCYVQVSGHTI